MPRRLLPQANEWGTRNVLHLVFGGRGVHGVAGKTGGWAAGRCLRHQTYLFTLKTIQEN